jgi:hypothetical protein
VSPWDTEPPSKNVPPEAELAAGEKKFMEMGQDDGKKDTARNGDNWDGPLGWTHPEKKKNGLAP